MNREKPRQEIEDAITAGDGRRLLEISGLLHGHFCPGSAMGVRAAMKAVQEMKTTATGMEEVIAIVETNSCFADGVQMVTGCSLGNNGLIYRDFGKTALVLVHRSGEGVRVTIKAGASPVQRNPEAAGLYQKVIAERRGTPEDDERLRQLWIDLSFDMMDIPDEELLTVQKVTTDVPAYARMFGSAVCSVCGESIMEPRARMKDGKPICLGCSTEEYYELNGNGMHILRRA